MLFSTALLGAAVALAGSASASASASAQTEEELELLAKARAAYPICAQKCMETLIPESDCELTDIPCLCTNEELNLQIAACAMEACTTYEGLQTKNASMTMCGAPVRDKSLEPLVIGMVFGGLALLAFILRMCSTLSSSGRPIGADDYMAVATIIFATPPTVFAVTLTNNGLGKDMWTLPLQNIVNVLRYYYLGELFYFASITANKLSLLLFMLRVFPDRQFRMVVYAVGGLVIAYGISFIFATAFQCSPVEWSWQQVDDEWGTGTCNNISMQGWMSAIINIIIDIIMLLLPLRNLWRLHLQLKKKLMIMFMFSLGVFVTIISVIRLHSLVLFANSHNITWDYSEAAWWSTLEIHIGIVCACLPAVRHLLVSLGASVLRSTRLTSGGSATYGSRTGAGGNSSVVKGGSVVHTQEAPKRGDEGDFVPLVEHPNHKAFEKQSAYSSAGDSNGHGTDSVYR